MIYDIGIYIKINTRQPGTPFPSSLEHELKIWTKLQGKEEWTMIETLLLIYLILQTCKNKELALMIIVIVLVLFIK